MRYRELLAEYNVDLVLLPSSGAAHNLERLRSGETLECCANPQAARESLS